MASPEPKRALKILTILLFIVAFVSRYSYRNVESIRYDFERRHSATARWLYIDNFEKCVKVKKN